MDAIMCLYLAIIQPWMSIFWNPPFKTWAYFKDDPKKMDDDDMEQEHLYTASSKLVFEGCTFSILRASLELLNLQIVYECNNASLNTLLK